MTAMTSATASERRRVLENERETAKRWASNYVTERERRFARHIEDMKDRGYAVTAHQLDFVANIRTVLLRRGEVL